MAVDRSGGPDDGKTFVEFGCRPGSVNDVCVLGAFVSHHSWGGWVAGARRHGGGFGDGGGSGVGGRGRGGHMRVPLAYLYSHLNMLRFAQLSRDE